MRNATEPKPQSLVPPWSERPPKASPHTSADTASTNTTTTTTSTDTTRTSQTTTTSLPGASSTTTLVDPQATRAPPIELSPHTNAVLTANLEGASRLLAAIAGHQLEEVLALLAQAPYLLNGPIEGCRTALHIAARDGATAIVDALLRKGADANLKPPFTAQARDPDRATTPLHLAVVGGHEAVVRRLLDGSGTDVHAQTHSGATAFHLAIEAGQLAIARLLHTRGADIDHGRG